MNNTFLFYAKRQLLRMADYRRIPFAAVLLLHRVDDINPHRLWHNEHLKLSPEFLDRWIRRAKNMGFSFVSIDEMESILSLKKRARRILAITLDDGYADNFTHGLPIFKTLKVPFCIYVATGMVERELLFWWYIIEDVILQHDSLSLNNGSTFICKTREQKEQAFLKLRDRILLMPQEKLEASLSSLLCNYVIDWADYRDGISLSWPQLCQLAREPLATIGCHTHSHLSLRKCSDESIRTDINHSRQLMRSNVGIEMHHFAYPYGEENAVSEENIQLVKSLNFNTIATTSTGKVSHKTSLMELPRLFLTERNAFETLDYLRHEL